MKAMKKLIFAALVAVMCAATASAQDLLVTRDGQTLNVRVVKVKKKKVEYLRTKTTEPLYVIATKKIDYIQYPDGDCDIFDEKGNHRTGCRLPAAGEQPTPGTNLIHNPGEPPRWHGPVRPAVPVDELPSTQATAQAQPAPAEKAYYIGDIYERDGVRGIVVMTTDGGTHGTLMSLDEASLKWTTRPRKWQLPAGATDSNDGRANMQRIEEHIKANNLSWSDFPAFKWCRDKGEGWYLPALNEVYALGTMYNGGMRLVPDRKSRRTFNEKLYNAGGKVMHNTMFYHSSTESADDSHSSCYSHMGIDTPHSGEGNKSDELFVRAFHRF